MAKSDSSRKRPTATSKFRTGAKSGVVPEMVKVRLVRPRSTVAPKVSSGATATASGTLRGSAMAAASSKVNVSPVFRSEPSPIWPGMTKSKFVPVL